MYIVLKKPALIFLAVCGACLLLMYYQSNNTFHGKNRICSLETINSLQLEQDDACLVNLIRSHFLHPPSSAKLNLDNPEVENPSMGQAQAILEILNNKEKGFFIECGALDGEIRSNTMYMEQKLGWEGVLIEADPENFEKVKQKNRRAWSVPACLSTSSTPKKLLFDQRFNQGRISQNQEDTIVRLGSVHVQCFPIYSILAALNQTTVDYFSLDIEGDELAVLKTIPWDRVNIKTLSVEFIHGKEGKEEIKLYMEKQGYRVFKEVTDPNWLANDFIFYKD